MRFILAWSGALALLLLAGIPAIADVNGLVHGHVTLNGAARAGVDVTVSGENTTERTTTDANGNFTFTRIPFGPLHPDRADRRIFPLPRRRS